MRLSEYSFPSIGFVGYPDPGGLDGYAALPFQVHIIQDLVFGMPAVKGSGELEYPVGKRGFTVIYMRYNAEVANQ